MRHLTFESARPLDTDSMPWIPTGPGKSFRPLRFTEDGWCELMRLEPGSAVAVHRHTGEVHAFNLGCTSKLSAPSSISARTARSSTPSTRAPSARCT